MKTVMQFLSLVLCFELVLGPVQGSILSSSVAYADDCPPGQVWTSLGRCQISDQSLNVSNQVNACTTADCFKNNANKALTDKDAGMAAANNALFKDDGSGEQKLGIKAANAAVIAIPLVIITSVLLQKRDATEARDKTKKDGTVKTKKNGDKKTKDASTSRAGKDFSCKPPSLLIMYAAAAAMAVGEIYGYFNHKEKLKQIQDDWDKTVMPKNEDGTDQRSADASEAQSQAFEFLAQNEDQVAKTTKIKKGFYIAATGLFAAGMIAATVELFQLNIAKKVLKSSTPGSAESIAAQQKIAKLTCNTDKSLHSDAALANEKAEVAEKAAEKKASEDAAAKTENEKNEKEFEEYETKRSELQNKNAELQEKRDSVKSDGTPKYDDNSKKTKTDEINKNNEAIAKLDQNQAKKLDTQLQQNSEELKSLERTTGNENKIKILEEQKKDITKRQETTKTNNEASTKTVNESKAAAVVTKDKDGVVTKDKDGVVTKDKDGVVTKDKDGVVTKDKDGVVTKDKDGVVTKEAGNDVPQAVAEVALSSTPLTEAQNAAFKKHYKGKSKDKMKADLKSAKKDLETSAKDIESYEKQIVQLKKDIEDFKSTTIGTQQWRARFIDEKQKSINKAEERKERAQSLHDKSEATIQFLNNELNLSGLLKLNRKSAIETFVSIYKQNRLDVATFNGNKNLAIKNISGARNTTDLLNLMTQLEDMKSENVSHLSYIDNEMSFALSPIKIDPQVAQAVAESLMNQEAEELAELTEKFNSVELNNYANYRHVDANKPAKSISDVILPKAHAEGGLAKVADLGGKVLPMVGKLGPLMQKILGVVKTSGGIPLPASKLNEIHGNTNSFIIKAIGNPWTRFGINALLGTWTGIMSHHMQKQQRLSENRAVALRAMKEEFVTTNGIISCTVDDRLDPTKPRCFCYTAENKINPDRSKQPACYQEAASLKFASKDSGDSGKVCVDQNMNMDAACACRAKKSCMKITSGFSTSGFNVGSFKMISSGSAPAQDLFNGNVGGADIADSAGLNAVNIRKAADDMLAKVDPKAVKEKNSFANGLQKGFLATTSGLSMGSLGGSSPLPSSPAGAAAALDKELKANKDDDAAQKAGSTYHGADFNDDSEPDPTAIATDEPGTEELEIAEVMEKEIDTGDSDINNASHTNIFDVLSNRYKRSGMRRLFEDGKSIPVDAPSKTEIAE